MFFVNTILTPFGAVRVSYTGAGHACVLTDSSTGPIEVRAGSPLILNLHIYRNETGQFSPKSGESLILTKYNWTNYNTRHAAPTFVRRVLEVIPPLVSEFLNAHAAECAAEDVENIRRQITTTQKDIDELEGKLAPLMEKKEGLEKEREEFEDLLRLAQSKV